MAKIERKYMAHFINGAKSGEPAVYERLGQDLEEFSPEMSAQVETKKNILGESSGPSRAAPCSADCRRSSTAI